MSAAEKLRLTEEIVASIASAVQGAYTDEEICDMFVDSCCFRQVLSKWHDKKTGLNLLQLAVYHKRFAIVKLLCKSDSPLVPWKNDHDDDGCLINSPFLLACYVGALDIIQYFLSSEVEFADLMMLRSKGYVNLSKHDQDDQVQPRLPFEICVGRGHVECSMFLCHLILSKCIYKDTPRKMAMLNASSIHQACHLGSSNFLALLLSQPAVNCYINSHDSVGFTPLHIAAMCGDHDCLETLLQHGANVHAYCDCRSPLHILYSYKQRPEDFVRCTEVLISFGADVNASDHNDNTPIDYVAYEFGQQTLKHGPTNVLLAYTDYEAHRLAGETPAMKGSQYRQELLETMRLLLEAGAHTHKIIAHTQDGILVDHTIIHTLLQNTGWPLSSCLRNSAQDVFRALELFLKFGCDTNVLAKHSLTSGFSMLLLHSLQEISGLQLKCELVYLFVRYGAKLECIVPPPRHFRKHPTERIWSVPPVMLVLQEKLPMDIITFMINCMSLGFVNTMMRSSKMNNWLMYVLQSDDNKLYRKEWILLKHKLKNSVRSLRHFCKLCVILNLKKPAWEVKLLPIPKSLQQYLLGHEF